MNLLGNKFVTEWLQGLGRITLLAKESIQSLFTFHVTVRDFMYQLYFIGVKSQSVVLVTGAFTGMVLCAQTYFQFHKVKMDTATLAVVSVSMCSELGPVLTALMVAGRVGASMAAEIGTMKVTEQIDALRTLATHPVDYLVVPRLLSSLVALPLLTIESIAVGITSGYLVGVYLLGVDPAYSYYNMLKYTQGVDVMVGVIKAFIFGGIIAIVGCYKGMYCGQGAEGVGRASTESFVTSFVAILVLDFFLRGFGFGRYSLFAAMSGWIVRKLSIKNKPIDQAPKVFAARLGFGMAILLFLSDVLSELTAAYVIASVFVLLSFLESALGICVGCHVYTLVKRLFPGALKAAS